MHRFSLLYNDSSCFAGVTGKYFQDGVESTPQGDTLDTEKQKQLWDKTMEIVGLLPVQSSSAV